MLELVMLSHEDLGKGCLPILFLLIHDELMLLLGHKQYNISAISVAKYLLMFVCYLYLFTPDNNIAALMELH